MLVLVGVFIRQMQRLHKVQLAHKDEVQRSDVELQLRQSDLQAARDQCEALTSRLAQYEHNVALDQQQTQTVVTELAVLKSNQQSEKQHFKEKIELLEQSKQSLKAEFENLAKQLLTENVKSLQEKQEGFFAQTMQPLKVQLQEFRQRIDKVYDVDSRDRVSLLSELQQLKSLNQQVSSDAINLTNALKGSQKFQGSWGELVLERVLETSGLRAGHEFELQAARKNDHGKTQLPDVIVKLPDNKQVIIDSKVSLLDYQRYCEASCDEDRQQYLKQHILSIQTHVKSLSEKKYDNLKGVNSLDVVFMFLPVEAAFLLAIDSQPELFQFAYDKHVILVCPSTLLTTLRTIENLWQVEHQNSNAQEIAKQAGGLYDQCVLVAEALDDVGHSINKSHDAYELAAKRLSSGRGNVIKRIESIKQLGAKTKKKLPKNLMVDDPDLLNEVDSSDESKT